MEIFIKDENHWILKPTFEERKEILAIARKLKVRPSEYLVRVINMELIKDTEMLK